ncbi:MAG TPA: proline iminopeptidase-family hydrolase [Streptosporangiaceae bacterium]|nr:proline iminopeptidase-family hydrolase [Streptosporangiaceae bacterium]
MSDPATAEGYIEVPGGRVWYRIIGTDRPGVPVLCLHGGPGMPHDYLEPLAGLAASRPVIFYDQLGCGRSDRPGDDSLWTTDRFVEELAVVRAALGLGRLHLFGNSWGGWLALQYTLDRRPELASLILSSSPPSVSRWITDCAELRAALDQPVRDVLDSHEAGGYFSCPEYQWAITQFYRRHVCRQDPWPDCLERTFAGLGADVYLTMWGPSEFGPVTGRLHDWDVTSRLPEIAVPALVTGGRYDEARPAHLALLAQGLRDAELVIFENSSHLAFIEERESYLRVVEDFLARVEGRAGRSHG